MSGWNITHELSPEEVETVYGWISGDSYWARGIPRSLFERSLANSLLFALRDEAGRLCGFARVVTDRATFGYLCDVFVCPTVRGQGAGKALVQAALDHPDVQLLRRWMLATQDAQGLYAQFGFEAPANPQRLMVRLNQGLYDRLNA